MRLLLLGAGHAHLEVLRRFALHPPRTAQGRAVELYLVTADTHALYTGMLPGWIANHYALSDCSIRLQPLAQHAGATLIIGCCTALDLTTRTARLNNNTTIAFDFLSIDIGSSFDAAQLPGLQQYAVGVRPVRPWVEAWQNLLQQPPSGILTVVGGGAAGTEIALAMAWRAQQAPWRCKVQLITGAPGLLPQASASFQRLSRHALERRQVQLIQDNVLALEQGFIRLTKRSPVVSHFTVVALGAMAAPWLSQSGLACDHQGFIQVTEQLQSVSHPFVFAAGDCASMVAYPRPKSGVWAVRAGPPLAHNLRTALAANDLSPTSLTTWRPQQRALYLLSTGPREAIANWGALSLQGSSWWRLKNHIDRRFVARYQY